MSIFKLSLRSQVLAHLAAMNLSASAQESSPVSAPRSQSIWISVFCSVHAKRLSSGIRRESAAGHNRSSFLGYRYTMHRRRSGMQERHAHGGGVLSKLSNSRCETALKLRNKLVTRGHAVKIASSVFGEDGMKPSLRLAVSLAEMLVQITLRYKRGSTL
ncbi:hypothetical protein B0H13DRAFT_1886827 [Mycena leptocephala]|nr:hypothetical protein B0H13DRAFT_1886827 [Mycena leptocephala]